MGFFKRFFSIGSRKSKKRSLLNESLPQDHPQPCHDDGSEAAVSRLLRSSSGRIMPDGQIGLHSLPPLPHPIDSVIPPPKSSSTTIASVSARSTYSVIIRSRTVHSRTEFPNAYPPMNVTPKRSFTDPRRRSKSVPITPRDKSRLMLLRQDPSVASLLNHYDDQGHLNSALFSNTPSPQKDACIQRRRTGSTLRQLLGHPSSPDLRNSMEGDISWAEKFLGETDDNSSVSSMGPRTPVDTHFPHTHSVDKTTLSIECDTSVGDQPTFSSLEVELSASTDYTHTPAPNSPNGSSTTSQRASQIFGFLGDKKKVHDSPVSRLPQLRTTTPNYRRFSADSSASDTKPSQIPLPRRSNTYILQSTSPTIERRTSLASDMSRSPLSPIGTVPLLPEPTDESLSPSTTTCHHTEQSGRSIRGPPLPSKIPSRLSIGPLPVPCGIDESHLVTRRPVSMQFALGEKLNSADKHVVPRIHEMHSQIPKLRTASGSSSGSAESKYDPIINSPMRHPIALQPGVLPRPRPTEAEPLAVVTPYGKENDVLSRLPQPVTPIRPFGFHLRDLPSPTSSSELSPVAKQMMANLRQQRMDARQRERQSGRLGSGQSRIR